MTFWFFSFFCPPTGCNDAFVEVGMPRSPSHSGNAGDLKQMLGPSKVSCAKRQTVELLQGTKNSHLQYVCSSCWEEMVEEELTLSSVVKTLTQVGLDFIVGISKNSLLQLYFKNSMNDLFSPLPLFVVFPHLSLSYQVSSCILKTVLLLGTSKTFCALWQ